MESGVFAAVDGPQVVRVVCLQAVVAEQVNAGQLVLQLAVEFLKVLHPWTVPQVAPRANAEPQDGEPQQGLRMGLRFYLLSRDGVVAGKQPDCQPRQATVLLVQAIWVAGKPQDWLRELRWRHLSVAQQPFVSARRQRLQVRKSPDQGPDRRQDPET